MGRKCIEVKSLYELSIDDLNLIAKNSESNYTRDIVATVIMRYNGVHPQIIADTLCKSRATIVSYLNDWNSKGIACIADHRGGNIPSSLDDNMIEDIRNIVTNKSPYDFGYEQNKWNTLILCRYIEDTYGKKYSDTWIRLLLKGLGFYYKRGVYKSSLADELLQESFKKNGYPAGYY
ncbi:MAG: winged helix-turn-helix domain-containing protein [Clostridia bacterium]|nr:winged helix-turn-helix domain-containing protein [Clostridia bacterium]